MLRGAALVVRLPGLGGLDSAWVCYDRLILAAPIISLNLKLTDHRFIGIVIFVLMSARRVLFKVSGSEKTVC